MPQVQRNTRQRQLVLDAVRARCDHPTADQIYLDVRERDSHVSRGTVYRNLAILAENGDVLQIETPHASRYDLTVRQHCHMACTGCGAVFDVPIEYRDDLDLLAQKLTGCLVQEHTTLFRGLCPECREAAEAQEAQEAAQKDLQGQDIPARNGSQSTDVPGTSYGSERTNIDGKDASDGCL